jgi:hypothetical protein
MILSVIIDRKATSGVLRKSKHNSRLAGAHAYEIYNAARDSLQPKAQASNKTVNLCPQPAEVPAKMHVHASFPAPSYHS